MTYCALGAVEGRLRGPALTAASTPTASEAEDMIADVAAAIDAALASHGITTPVASPAAFAAWLATVNADGATSSVLTARFADDRGPNSNTAAARWERRYQDAMARLWDGSAIPDSLSQTSASLPSSLSTSYTDAEPVLSTLRTPAFGSGWEL